MEKHEIQAAIAANKARLAVVETEMRTSAKKIADSLKEIHDRKLWMDGTYKSFDHYCQTRWGMSRARAYQILQAKTMRDMLTDAGAPQEVVEGLSDRAAIELTKTPEPEKVLKEITKKGGEPTAKRIKLEVAPPEEAEAPPPSKPCDACQCQHDALIYIRDVAKENVDGKGSEEYLRSVLSDVIKESEYAIRQTHSH